MKKAVKEQIEMFFNTRIRDIEHQIWKNKYEMKKLVETQTILKRTKAELYKLRSSLTSPATPPNQKTK
jgi:hypothetical protein